MTIISLKRRVVVLSALGVGCAALGFWALSGRGGSARAPALPPRGEVIALGDSLTFGYGAPRDASWPSVLSSLSGHPVTNLGVSGDTAAGGMRRLDAELRRRAGERQAMPAAVIVALGGNDMLRKRPDDQTVRHLIEIIAMARGAVSNPAHVALVATPRPALTAAIGLSLSDADFYADVAAQTDVPLVESVYSDALSDSSLRSDRIHANAAGYLQIGRRIWHRLAQQGWWPAVEMRAMT